MSRVQPKRSVTLVMAYYDNPKMLAIQCADLAALPSKYRANIELILVDDGSPRWPAKLASEIGVNVQHYRVTVDVRWNQHAARNIGVHHASHPWLLLTDIDHRIPLATWQKILCSSLNKNQAYWFERVSAPDLAPYKTHPNSWLMMHELFDKIGGYDERFAGYYGTDADFRHRVLDKCRRIIVLKTPLIRVPREVIADASTTTYERKTPDDRANVARIKTERAMLDNWRPINLSFPYERVR